MDLIVFPSKYVGVIPFGNRLFFVTFMRPYQCGVLSLGSLERKESPLGAGLIPGPSLRT